MFCRKCGQRIASHVDVCPSCGTRVSEFAVRQQQNTPQQQVPPTPVNPAPTPVNPAPTPVNPAPTPIDSSTNTPTPQGSATSSAGSSASAKSWGIGAKIWFALAMLGEWLNCIDTVTMPAFAYDSTLQMSALFDGVGAAMATALYIWLIVSKKKVALYTILVIHGLIAVSALTQGGMAVFNVVGAVIFAAITWAVAYKVVE